MVSAEREASVDQNALQFFLWDGSFKSYQRAELRIAALFDHETEFVLGQKLLNFWCEHQAP